MIFRQGGDGGWWYNGIGGKCDEMDLNGWYYRYIKMIFGIVESKTVCKALIKKRMMKWETVGVHS